MGGDRELFKDLVGGVDNSGGVIDNMVPETREEFEAFGKLVAEKFAALEGSDHFQDFAANFIEILCRDQLNVATLKKATQKTGRANDHMSLAGGGYDDMVDFM